MNQNFGSLFFTASTHPGLAADILFAHEINENHETFRQ